MTTANSRQRAESDLEGGGCSRCKCCDTDWQDCEMCVDGFDGHDCGDDCCVCADPDEPNVPCQICDANGGWYLCVGNCRLENGIVVHGSQEGK